MKLTVADLKIFLDVASDNQQLAIELNDRIYTAQTMRLSTTGLTQEIRAKDLDSGIDLNGEFLIFSADPDKLEKEDFLTEDQEKAIERFNRDMESMEVFTIPWQNQEWINDEG